MITETYKGRKIKVVKGKGADWGYARLTVNGVDLGKYMGDEANAVRSARGTIDHAEEVGVGSARYQSYWYAPGTYELCENGHAREIGGLCGHSYCIERRPVPTATEVTPRPAMKTIRLTAKMADALGNTIEINGKQGMIMSHPKTQAALAARGLATEHGYLTDQGRFVAHLVSVGRDTPYYWTWDAIEAGTRTWLSDQKRHAEAAKPFAVGDVMVPPDEAFEKAAPALEDVELPSDAADREQARRETSAVECECGAQWPTGVMGDGHNDMNCTTASQRAKREPVKGFVQCWNCRQPATHTLTREGSKTLNACDNCTRIDRPSAEEKGWTVAKNTETPKITEYSVKIWYRSGAYEGAPHCPEDLARKIYADAAASAGVEFAELHGPSGKLVASRGPSDGRDVSTDPYPNAPAHNPFLPDSLTPGP